jgi:uncharacterized hydrophobic protein (TIGR00341 family)
MTVRLLEISAPQTASKLIEELAQNHHAIDVWYGAVNSDKRRSTRILVRIEHQQDLMDAIQRKLNTKYKNWRLVILPVETTLPMVKEPAKEPDNDEDDTSAKAQAKLIVRGSITREALYQDIKKGAQLNFNFLMLVFLSALVAAIGLVTDNVAVIIGAMVIAPLLGPNLALAFGAALGDKDLMADSIRSNASGLLFTIALSAFIGFLFNFDPQGKEVFDRTTIGFEGIVLALASGAAAVLSITTGLSSALVGVMVAVALMPPAVTAGLMLGVGEINLAYGAGLLLLTNIVCVSLAAQLVFLLRGIKPRTWYKQKKSRQSVRITVAFWILLLILISGLIILRDMV